MIIDTERLIEAVNSYFFKQGEYIDNNVKNHIKAIKKLTYLEQEEMKIKSLINQVEKLYENYVCFSEETK